MGATALKQRLDGGEAVAILDTRCPEDVAEWTISHPNATVVNVPFTAFLGGEAPAAAVPAEVPDGPLVTCCAKWLSSEYVAEFLAEHGHEGAALDDGMEGWARLYRKFPPTESSRPRRTDQMRTDLPEPHTDFIDTSVFIGIFRTLTLYGAN